MPALIFMPRTRKESTAPLEKDPLWYKNGVIYQGHVRAFCDSDGNGIGDFRGLISKLDYIEALGVTTLVHNVPPSQPFRISCNLPAHTGWSLKLARP